MEGKTGYNSSFLMEVQRTHNVTLASGAQRRDSTALPHAVLTGSIAAICPYTALLPH